jgi:endophilin-A
VDNTLKLQTAEQKMGELTSAMAVLGKEAAAAMTAVEAQQQRLTLQRLIAMVSLVDNRNSKFHLYICLPNRYK